MMSIAVVGAGRMGLPICARLIQAGHEVIAADLVAERRRAAHEIGAVTDVELLDAVQQADLVITILPGSPELEALMLGPDGLLTRMTAEQTWIDMTSTAPVLGQELAVQAAARGVGVLDAALGGGPADVEAGTLTLFVGGDAATVSAVQGVLEAIARPGRILHMGGPGTGYLTKLLINLLWFGQALAVGEALLLGQAGGLDLPLLQQVLTGSAADSAFIRTHLPRLFGDDYLATFGLDRIVEELESLQALAAERAVPFELSSLVAELHGQALRQFGPVDGELMGIAYLEELAGRRLRP